MEKLGNIEIKIEGKSGNDALRPENYDIRHIASLLADIENLLFPNNKKDRPVIT